MKLITLIDNRISFEESFKNELLKMDCFFQDHLWDGISNENDPKFITNDDFIAIQALTDKINHMVLNIGCPNSVLPMLQSIATRRIKRWQAHDNVESKDKSTYKDGKKVITSKGFKKGKQLRNNDDLRRVYNQHDYYFKQVQEFVISGHFRWNDRGYIFSRRATDLLEEYLT